MRNLYRKELSFNHNPKNKYHCAFYNKLKKAKWIHISKGGNITADFNALNVWLIRKYNKSLILLKEDELKKSLNDFEKEIVREKFIKEILKLQ